MSGPLSIDKNGGHNIIQADLALAKLENYLIMENGQSLLRCEPDVGVGTTLIEQASNWEAGPVVNGKLLLKRRMGFSTRHLVTTDAFEIQVLGTIPPDFMSMGSSDTHTYFFSNNGSVVSVWYSDGDTLDFLASYPELDPNSVPVGTEFQGKLMN